MVNVEVKVTSPKRKRPAPKPAKFEGKTFICFVLDKSGSMSGQREQAISAFNEFVDSQKKVGNPNDSLTLVLFDTSVLVPIQNTPLQSVPQIGRKDYAPSGMTALHDSVHAAIRATDGELGPDDRALVLIFTDGYENSSKETTREQVVSLIKEREAKGNWTFTYMGAGTDWKQQAESLGIKLGNSFQFDPQEMKVSLNVANAATASYRASGVRAMNAFYQTAQPDLGGGMGVFKHSNPVPQAKMETGVDRMQRLIKSDH